MMRYTHPAPYTLHSILCRHVARTPQVTFLQTQSTQQHFTETQLQHPVSIQSSNSIRIVRSTILAMQIELFMSELCHQLGHITGLFFGSISFRSGRLVRVAKTSQIGSDQSEVRCQQWEYSIPVKAVLGSSMEEEKRRSGSCCDIVKTNAVDAGSAMFDWSAGVVVRLCKFRCHDCRETRALRKVCSRDGGKVTS